MVRSRSQGRGRGAGPGLESHLVAPRPGLHAPPGDKHVRRPSEETGLLTVMTGNPPGLPGCAGQTTGREGPAYCRPVWSLSPSLAEASLGKRLGSGTHPRQRRGCRPHGATTPPKPLSVSPTFCG